MATPPRKILLVVTVGGYTHAAPVIELGRVLVSRGHTVDFATLEGQEKWQEDFMSTVHSMGPGPSDDVLEAHYLRMRDWDAKKGFDLVMDSKYMFDSYWTQTYKHLKTIMANETTRPDMIVADFFVDAVKDMQIGEFSALILKRIGLAVFKSSFSRSPLTAYLQNLMSLLLSFGRKCLFSCCHPPTYLDNLDSKLT